MSLKKKKFSESEFPIYDEAIIYLRGDIWQFRMWINDRGGRYVRFSLGTKNQAVAESKAKQHYHQLMADTLAGKRYFSLTTKDGVKLYLDYKQQEIDSGLIVKGRHTTIKTHLEHWLDFIGRETKLTTLDRWDCEDYAQYRTKTKKKIAVSQTTIINEQATINAMMSFLFKRKETNIDSFEFKPFQKIDRGIETNRRSLFTNDELKRVQFALEDILAGVEGNESSGPNTTITCFYLLISSVTGLRRGEQLQLCWADINRKFKAPDGQHLVRITIRGETSKVRKTRHLLIVDPNKYFDRLFKISIENHKKAYDGLINTESFLNRLIFSTDGDTAISPRSIEYNFTKAIVKAQIDNLDERDLVPYSFRHTFITQLINAGLSISSVSEMCGTSSLQIQNTYYHTTTEKMVHNALAFHQHQTINAQQ